MKRFVSSRNNAILAIALSCIVSIGCEQPEPLSDDDREMVDLVAQLLECAASENDVITELSATGSLPAFRGEVRPPAAVACLRDLNDRGRTHSLHEDEIHRICGHPLAGACVPQNYNGCDEPVYFRDDLIPESFLDYSPVGEASRVTSLGLAVLAYHESIHTVQTDRFRDCAAAMEVEAQDHESRVFLWLTRDRRETPEHGQIRRLIETEGDDEGIINGIPPVCRSIDGALANGMSPCVADFIASAFPDVPFDEPFTGADCRAIVRLLSRGEVSGGADVNYREMAVSCMTTGAASMDLRASSQDFSTLITADPVGIVYQFSLDGPSGTPTLVHSFNPGLDSISDLAILRDDEEREYLVVAGTLAGAGAIRVRQDSQPGEFYTPPDGIFDGLSGPILSDPRLREVTEIVPAGAHPPMAWDRQSQTALRLTRDAQLLPTGFSTLTNLRVPIGLHAATIKHHPTKQQVFLSPDRSPDGDATVHSFYAPIVGYPLYVLEVTHDVGESSLLPPSFVTVPFEGATKLRISGPLSKTVELSEVDASGTTVSVLDVASIGVSGEAEVHLTSPLVAGQHVRLVTTSSGLASRTVTVTSADHPRADYLMPAYGHVTGGTELRIRGSGFTSITKVMLDDIEATSFTVVSDDALAIVTPPALPGSYLIEAETPSGTYVLGTYRYQNEFIARFSGQELASTWHNYGLGWTCGATALASPPRSGDVAGCQYVGGTDPVDILSSPLFAVPPQLHLEMLIHHRGQFDDDGDGVVLLVYDGNEVHNLTPRARTAHRVHNSTCVGTGPSRGCMSPTPADGMRGYTHSSVPRAWRTDLFEVPAWINLGAMQIGLAATNANGVGIANHEISFVEIRQKSEYGAVILDESGWVTHMSQGHSCSALDYAGAFSGGHFECRVVNGNTLMNYHDAPLDSSDGYFYLPVDLSGLAGRQVSVRLRHAVQFRQSTGAVTTGSGRIRVWCSENQGIVAPLDGYGAIPPGAAAGFTGEGPQHTYWASDEFDISSFAGMTSCWIDLLANGKANAHGWAIDSLEVRWR